MSNPLITAATKAACREISGAVECRAPACSCRKAPGVAIMVLRSVVKQRPARWDDPLWVELYGDVTPGRPRP